MYPYTIIFGMTAYEIFILIGVIGIMIAFRVFADKKGYSARFQNFILAAIVITILCGYGSAVLFQAFYNYLATGIFKIDSSTGATFYGGFIGGVTVCVIIYFVAGHFLFKDKEHLRAFPHILDCGGFCVPLAHGFGRLGCLLVGCCHGGYTDAWYGIPLAGTDKKIIPLQLYESIFLLSLFAFLFIRAMKKDKYTQAMPIYLSSYAVWRFIIEFFRTDDRGASPISFLSPSQFTAVLLVAVAIVLYILMEKLYVRKKQKD